MFAKVINDEITLLNGRKGWVDSQGLKHPASALNLWSNEELAKADVFPVQNATNTNDPSNYKNITYNYVFDTENNVVLKDWRGEELSNAEKAARLNDQIQSNFLKFLEEELGDLESRLGHVAAGALALDKKFTSPELSDILEANFLQPAREQGNVFQTLQNHRDSLLARVEGGELDLDPDEGWATLFD